MCPSAGVEGILKQTPRLTSSGFVGFFMQISVHRPSMFEVQHAETPVNAGFPIPT